MSIAPEIGKVIHRVFRSMFSGDLDSLQRDALPHPHLVRLVTMRPPVEDLDWRLEELQMHEIARYPDGHVIAHAFFLGCIMPITLRPDDSGAWKADMRWWMVATEPPTELFQKARMALYAMVTGDDELLSKTCFFREGIDLLTQSGAPSGEHGVYEDVCANMPMIELAAGERYPWPVGEMDIAKPDDCTGDHRLLMAQFGGDEITFRMKRINGEWFVDPEPFITMAQQRGQR
jgi:hypothetical protein